MIFRVGIFLVLVVALIAVSAFGIEILNKSREQPAVAAVQTEQILAAAGTLQAGALLQPTDLSSISVAVNAVPDGASLDTPANRSGLIGSMIRQTIAPNAPILASAVIHPGDHGFLAAVLAPGMRAVTVGVDAISGAAGLIWPGDHVDILLTQTLDDPSVPIGQRIAAEVVLDDVRVIATGQQLVSGGGTAANGGAPGPGAPATTVTLEVTPNQAARCEVATRLGSLSLVVQESTALPKPVWADEVSPALTNTHPGAPVITTVHVFNGDSGGSDYNF
jgi:pilus assembly protein CpaB